MLASGQSHGTRNTHTDCYNLRPLIPLNSVGPTAAILCTGWAKKVSLLIFAIT